MTFFTVPSSQTCAFTGHRPERLTFSENEVVIWLRGEIRRAVNDGYKAFVSGMQRGVDIWAAEEVLRLREAGEPLCLVAVPAFKGMELAWNESWGKRYNTVLDSADEVVYISEKPGRAAFILRDRYIVDRAARLIAVYSGGGGGTLETIKYAEQKRIEIIAYRKGV